MIAGSARFPLWAAFIGFILAGSSIVWPRDAAAEGPHEGAVTISSPDGAVRIEFMLAQEQERAGVPSYRVLYRGEVVVERSSLGVDFAETGPFCEGLRIVDVQEQSGDETWEVIAGKSATVRDHWNGAVVLLEEQPSPNRRIGIELRAYDDGAAFRYRFPEQPAFEQFTITDEHSQFHLAREWTAYVLPLDGYAAHYEAKYRILPVGAIEPDWHVGLPLLIEAGEGAWLAITEANLTDYAGMYLSGVEGAPGMLTSSLSPWPQQPQIKVRASAPHVSPWRVVMIADDPGRLIESNLVLNLNEPSRIDDPSWIRPGRTTFPWWNDYVLEDVDFEPGLSTETMKHYIDFCAEHGIEYHSLDGFRGEAWYGGRIRPYEGQDITSAIDGLDLEQVLAYARERGVRLRLWMHWEAAREQMDRAFPIYQQWGIEGIMVDFMNRDDQEMVNFYHEVLRTAAEHRLTVNFHGAYKPTGIRRTWPNLLTREGVFNAEYNKFGREGGSTPGHEVLVAFTRMLAGPLDYHQGGFRHVRVEDFEPRMSAPVVMGTRARQLAMFIVYENPLPMLADSPDAYRGQAGFEFLTQVPVTWDETRVLGGTPVEQITIARRRGEEWYVGSMTDQKPRETVISLDFLGDGEFTAVIYADDPDPRQPPSAVVRRMRHVAASDTITIRMAPAGGHVMRIIPAVMMKSKTGSQGESNGKAVQR